MMNSSLKVSVLMPAYNSEKYIGESIESVLNQTYQNIELIIVNDGSNDNTEAVVKKYQAKDSRIKYQWQMNGRQGKARNTALKLATGDLIALLDSDDLWDKDKTERQLRTMTEQRTDFIFSNARLLYSGPETRAKYDKALENLSGGMAIGRFEGKQMFELLSESNRIVTTTAMFRRECIEKAGGFEEDVKYQNCEDYELWLRMSWQGCNFYGMPEILATYRIHYGGATLDLSSQLIPEIRVIQKMHEAGMIPKERKDKTISWLTQVLSYSYYASGKKQELRDLLNGKKDISFLPYGKFFYIRKLLIRIGKEFIKRSFKKMGLLSVICS